MERCCSAKGEGPKANTAPSAAATPQAKLSPAASARNVPEMPAGAAAPQHAAAPSAAESTHVKSPPLAATSALATWGEAATFVMACATVPATSPRAASVADLVYIVNNWQKHDSKGEGQGCAGAAYEGA